MDHVDIAGILGREGKIIKASRANSVPGSNKPHLFYAILISDRQYVVVAREMKKGNTELFYYSVNAEIILSYKHIYKGLAHISSESYDFPYHKRVNDYQRKTSQDKKYNREEVSREHQPIIGIIADKFLKAPDPHAKPVLHKAMPPKILPPLPPTLTEPLVKPRPVAAIALVSEPAPEKIAAPKQENIAPVWSEVVAKPKPTYAALKPTAALAVPATIPVVEKDKKPIPIVQKASVVKRQLPPPPPPPPPMIKERSPLHLRWQEAGEKLAISDIRWLNEAAGKPWQLRIKAADYELLAEFMQTGQATKITLRSAQDSAFYRISPPISFGGEYRLSLYMDHDVTQEKNLTPPQYFEFMSPLVAAIKNYCETEISSPLHGLTITASLVKTNSPPVSLSHNL